MDSVHGVSEVQSVRSGIWAGTITEKDFLDRSFGPIYSPLVSTRGWVVTVCVCIRVVVHPRRGFGSGSKGPRVASQVLFRVSGSQRYLTRGGRNRE